MTAEEETKPEEAIYNQVNGENHQTIPVEIAELFEFLSLNKKIIFKSQQIDDPELERNEKVQIAQEIFVRNRQTFLQRFGTYFEEQHLDAFTRLTVTANWNAQESGDDIKDMLSEYRRRLKTRKRDVKNRRYMAMQQLIKQGDYFSELEMMNRAPELYQELVGQYLSETEIRQRDSYDVKNTTFSGILMHRLEQQQRDEMLKEADAELEKEQVQELEEPSQAIINQPKLIENIESAKVFDFTVEEDEESEEGSEEIKPNVVSTIDDYEVPPACLQQWGNFDNETVACSTSRMKKENKLTLNTSKKSISNVFITAGERDLLRQEFVGLMHERFLAGKDTNFDYSLIDENTQLDDLSQLNQDKEDAYFDNSDDDENVNASDGGHNDTESEDELDLYMRHLNQHHSLKT